MHPVKTPFLVGLLALLISLTQVATAAERVSLDHGDRELVGWWQSAGDGTPIIMLHGTLAHGRMEIMASFQELLAAMGRPSLSVNLSYGESGRTGMADCDMVHRHRPDDAAAELAAWADWLDGQGHGTFHLLAHSRGGADAARAVAAGTVSPESLLLVAPATWERDAMHADYEESHGTPLSEVLARAEAKRESDGGDAVLEGVGLLYCQQARATADALLGYYADNPGFDTPTALEQVERPTLVVIGAEDDVVADLPERIAAIELPNGSEVVTIDGAGHFFRDFFADDAIDAVTRFIDGL